MTEGERLSQSGSLAGAVDPAKGDLRRAYTISEVVGITGLKRTSLYAAIGRGLLRKRKFGRRSLILAEDLQEFLANLPSE